MTHAHTTPAISRLRPLVMALALGGTMSTAFATNGYFSHGYGMKAKGMGGAAIAMAEDAFAGANNPASASFSGNRFELGADLFMPRRDMTRTGGGLPAAVESDSNLFLIPEFGYNKTVNDKVSVGITVYGNGGMNTDYPGGQINCGAGPANVLCGSGRLGMGVDLMQLIVAPTLSYKINEQHAVGVSPLLVYQQFKVDGLQGFDNPMMSSAPGKVTNNGTDRSTGVGLRLGYMGKVTDTVTVGASYSPRIRMGKFDKYSGLFAGAGSMDIPEEYGLGVSLKATPTVTVAVDYQRINYSGVPAIGNPSANRALLGTANGPGFGWRDINVWKLGVQWQASSQFTLRAGYNKGQSPVQSSDVTFNILSPGVITSHVTLGATYALSPSTEMTMSYMHAPRQSVTGPSMFGGTETIRMRQNALGLQVGWKF